MNRQRDDEDDDDDDVDDDADDDDGAYEDADLGNPATGICRRSTCAPLLLKINTGGVYC